MNATPTSLASQRRKKCIMVVDDDEFTRVGIARMFRPEYEVVVAGDGAEALERALALPELDLVITDVWMPRLDGVALVTRMKQNPSLRHVPVIFLTGQTSPASVIAGIAAGARHYLAKPVDPEVLEEKVRRVLASPAR